MSVDLGSIEKPSLPFNGPDEKALTVNENNNPAIVLEEILANDFMSLGSVENKSKKELIGQLSFFWKMIPNLKWEIQEIINQENQYVVRSIATGNPQGNFMGLTTNGTKTFSIMTIDIHTIKNGKITKVYHIEDWATAIKQLKS